MKRFFCMLACCLLPLNSYQACYASEPESGLSVRGADLSHFNGKVDWEVIQKNNLHFVVLKATEGVDWIDPSFLEHWKNAKASGFIRGAYHFFVAHDDPVQEAQWFIRNVTLKEGDLPPIVDVERATKKEMDGLAENLEKLVQVLEDHYGVKPIIYTGPTFWNSAVKDGFADHHLWVAEYGVASPKLPGEWDAWTFWQFTQSGKLKGVEKEVDLNHFSHSLDSLKKLQIRKVDQPS